MRAGTRDGHDGRGGEAASAAAAKARALRPRDAATLDHSSTRPRASRACCLGRRRRDMVFMPGRYVFPGGRVDRADRQIAVEHDIGASELEKLMVWMKGTPSQARARALGAGSRARDLRGGGPVHRQAARRRRCSTRRRAGRPSLPLAYRPALDQLTFFARAITPPGRPRRYDTRFFCVAGRGDRPPGGVADGELSDLEWHSIAQARALELPNITRVVLEDLGERIAAGGMAHRGFPGAVLSSPQRQLPAGSDQRRGNLD